MQEKLNLKDFDILGMITLQDVAGIEKYVTPVLEDGQPVTYLSRSKEYYNVKSMTELAFEREELKLKLSREITKRNFVILENMLNCSAKVYFKKFEQYINSGKSENYGMQLKQAEDCLMEDVRNILVILQGNGLIELNSRNILPVGYENSEKRSIEMDNKAILYMFTRAIKLRKKPEDVEVLTPGYGSIYMGPFFKAMYGYNFTNTLKSKYIEESKAIQDSHISSLMSSNRAFEKGKTILLLDDNIGTGNTMRELKQELQNADIQNMISGAVQYNWRNYYRVSIGDKKDIDRFDITDFDIVTPFNYAGHKLYKHAIDMLHSSGKRYIEYLNSKSYRLSECCDIEGAMLRGLVCAHNSGLTLIDGIEIPESKNTRGTVELLDRYKAGPTEITNPISKRMIKVFVKAVQGLGDGQPNLAQIEIEI